MFLVLDFEKLKLFVKDLRSQSHILFQSPTKCLIKSQLADL